VVEVVLVDIRDLPLIEEATVVPESSSSHILHKYLKT
jgi:hypothetical protein